MDRGETTYNMDEKSSTSKWSLEYYRTRPWYFWCLLAAIMLLPTLILATTLTLAPHVLAAKHKAPDGPKVELDYATYEGTALNGVNQYLGVRYAAPPVKDLRFRGPKPPNKETKVQSANKVSSVFIFTKHLG